MTIVDLVKARAFANAYAEDDASDMQLSAVDWILSLADEVESLERTVTELRALVADVEAESAKTQDERDEALAALTDILGTIIKILPRV